MGTWELLALITIIAIALIVAYLIYKGVQRYLDINIRLGVYADVPYSVGRNQIHLNFINVNKHPEIWEAHESLLRFEAMGRVIEGIEFFRSPDIPTGLKIRYPLDLDHIQFLSLMAGAKYNKVRISGDGGETFYKVNSIKDSVVKKYKMKDAAITKEVTSDTLKQDLKDTIMNSEKFKYMKSEFGFDILQELTTYSHINEGKSTSTSLRYQALLPSDHETYEQFTKNKDNIRFYYIVDGKAYQFETKHITSIDDYHEWDFINLEPGKIYPGIAFSIDDGKSIHASSCLSGITKNDDGNLVVFDEAELAAPNDSTPTFIFKFDDTLETCGEAVTKATYNMIVKKHYEKDNEDSYVPLKIADQYYSEYDWIFN